MKRKRNLYEENKQIIADETTYSDNNTITLIDLIVNIIVDTTLAQAEKTEKEKESHARFDLDT